jgi:hypothetical protein
MSRYFEDFDFDDFWDDSEYSQSEYIEIYPTDELITSIEKEIGGYKLPESYIELMKMHNGGIPAYTCFPTEETSWAEDHIAITGIMGIGRTKPYSLCGQLGSNFMIEEWGYPKIGICIADTPSAGHDMIMLDYRLCGKEGEPQVVHVDQEQDYKITFLAETFEMFIESLVDEEEYDTSEFDFLDDLEKVRTGSFSPILLRAFAEVSDVLPDADKKIRRLAEKIVVGKGYFALHADDLSMLMYDYLFWLYSSYNSAKSYQHYMNSPRLFDTSYDLPSYTLMIVFCISDEPFEFETRGFAEAFLEEWWVERVAQLEIVKTDDGYRMTETFVKEMLLEIEKQTRE